MTREALLTGVRMAISITALKPGDVVFDAHYERARNTTLKRLGVWRVHIKDVDIEGRRVLASWNGNPAKWHYPRGGKLPWRRTDPTEVKRKKSEREAVNV